VATFQDAGLKAHGENLQERSQRIPGILERLVQGARLRVQGEKSHIGHRLIF